MPPECSRASPTRSCASIPWTGCIEASTSVRDRNAKDQTSSMSSLSELRRRLLTRVVLLGRAQARRLYRSLAGQPVLPDGHPAPREGY
jgi:hypothetical protein